MDKMVLSNLLKPLLDSRGLFKSGMSSLTVKVVVDEDEFISTKQTPAPVGESIKINYIIRRLRPLHNGTLVNVDVDTKFPLFKRRLYASVAAAAVGGFGSDKRTKRKGETVKRAKIKNQIKRSSEKKQKMRQHVSEHTGTRRSSREWVRAHVGEFF
jgi:hypothetical protein